MKTHSHPVRSIIVLAVTAAGFAASFVLLERALGSASPWLGLMGVFYFLGLAKVAEPLFLLRMPATLRTVRTWENDGIAYRRCLVPAFGTLLRETPLRFLNLSVYLARKQADLIDVYQQVEAAEAAHFWAAVLFTPYIAWMVWSGRHREATILLGVQIVLNIYPILHLRTVRGRMDRLLKRTRLRP